MLTLYKLGKIKRKKKKKKVYGDRVQGDRADTCLGRQIWSPNPLVSSRRSWTTGAKGKLPWLLAARPLHDPTRLTHSPPCQVKSHVSGREIYRVPSLICMPHYSASPGQYKFLFHRCPRDWLLQNACPHGWNTTDINHPFPAHSSVVFATWIPLVLSPSSL